MTIHHFTLICITTCAFQVQVKQSAAALVCVFFKLQTTAFWLAWFDTEQNLCLPPSEANLTSEWQAASLLQTLSSQLAAYPRATHQSLD